MVKQYKVFLRKDDKLYESSKALSLGHMMEAVSILSRMPGDYNIEIECDNKGKWKSPNVVNLSNKIIRFTEVKMNVALPLSEVLEGKEDETVHALPAMTNVEHSSDDIVVEVKCTEDEEDEDWQVITADSKVDEENEK